jgi:hypothetical protein
MPLESRLSKLSPSAVQCQLIGYADDDDTEEIKGYKLIRESDPTVIFYSSDVRFDESFPMTPLSGTPSFDPYDASIFTDSTYFDDSPEDEHSYNSIEKPQSSPPTAQSASTTPVTRSRTRAYNPCDEKPHSSPTPQ